MTAAANTAWIAIAALIVGVRSDPYAGEPLTVGHVVSRAASPALDLVLANLEFMPQTLNLRKGSKVGQRQIDLANKLHAAGLLSEMDRVRIQSRQLTGYDGS